MVGAILASACHSLMGIVMRLRDPHVCGSTLSQARLLAPSPGLPDSCLPILLLPGFRPTSRATFHFPGVCASLSLSLTTLHRRTTLQISVHQEKSPSPCLSPWSWKEHYLLVHTSILSWRRKWQPTPVFLPGESQGQRSLVGCRLWGRTESDTTEATQQQQQQQHIS